MGKAITYKFVAEVANVMLADITEDSLQEAVSTYKKDQVEGVIGDVPNQSLLKKLIKKSV